MTNTIECRSRISIRRDTHNVKKKEEKKREQAEGEFNFMIDRESVDFRVFISKVT